MEKITSENVLEANGFGKCWEKSKVNEFSTDGILECSVVYYALCLSELI